MDGFSLSELARWIGAECDGDATVVITDAAGIEEATAGAITFVVERRRLGDLANSAASAVILPAGWPSSLPALRCADPRAAFAKVLLRFVPSRERVFAPGVHPTAAIDPTADTSGVTSIGPHVVVGPGARIGAGSCLGAQVVVEADAVVGRDCTLHARVTLRERCRLGDRVVVHPGAVIGADGFGFVAEGAGRTKIPHIGTVEVGDDVEIGANVCIDRAQTGRTTIGRGSKIDNLVHVAHNVRLGEDCALAAQTGISGSCHIGDRVLMGGQVGISDHCTIGEGSRIAAQSGVHRDIEPEQTVLGSPSREIREQSRIVAALPRLPRLLERVRRLERDAQQRSEAGED
jgi:UDP-3-O-[3-hydroxymyristoyl] glucosamine N-acyltransferase